MRGNNIYLPKDHIALTSSMDIDDIVGPLKRLGILYFTYMRNYPDYRQIYLSNDSNWVEAYYGHCLYETSQFQLAPDSYRSGKVIWPSQSNLPVYRYARDHLNSDNGITIIKRNNEHTEFYFFSSSVGNDQIVNVYVNYLDMLEKFILYFNNRAEKIFAKAERDKIIMPSHLYQQDTNRIKLNLPAVDIINNIINDMRIKNYRIKHKNYSNVRLSSRELECIFLYYTGKTAKETALLLSISSRTVETYFQNIKNKLNCYTKDQIVKFLQAEGVF